MQQILCSCARSVHVLRTADCGLAARSCRHDYPQWRPQDLSRVFPSLEESGLELLRAMLQYDPARRISVSQCYEALPRSSDWEAQRAHHVQDGSG